jgi:hypothetical protein
MALAEKGSNDSSILVSGSEIGKSTFISLSLLEIVDEDTSLAP